MSEEQNADAVAYQFDICGEFLEAIPYGSGHINDTYRVTFHENGVPHRYILQRINHHIFKKPAALMENIQRVTAHLATQVANEPDWKRRALTLIPARDGRAWHVDAEGDYWRAYRFIEKARTYDAVESKRAGVSGGQGVRASSRSCWPDLPAPRLHDTIPDFHNTPKRFTALQAAIAADAAGRAGLAKAEIDFALAHESITGGVAGCEPAGARDAQRHQVQQRDAG